MIAIRLLIAAPGAAVAALVLGSLGAPVSAAAVGAVAVGVLAFLAFRPHPSRHLAEVSLQERRGADRRAGVDRRRPDPPPYFGPERRQGERRKGDRRDRAPKAVHHSEEALLAEQEELEEGRAARRARRAGDPDPDD